MAERSKAIDSSSILFGGVSSNLTGRNVFVQLFVFFYYTLKKKKKKDSMAEWLRREIRNLMGSARVGSNPAAVGNSLSFFPSSSSFYSFFFCSEMNRK